MTATIACPRCGSIALSNGTCSSLTCYLESRLPSPLDTFIAALTAMPSFDREKVMDELRERVCLFCGGPPDCECWRVEEVVQA